MDKEEAEAIREALGEVAELEVVECDFGLPRRFDAAALEELARRLQNAVPSMEATLSQFLGTACPVRLASIVEASAEEVATEGQELLATASFDVGGQPGWLAWQNLPALLAVERSLGSNAANASARRLSRLECTLLERLFDGLVAGILQPVDLAATSVAFTQSRRELGTWRDATENASPHRVLVQFEVEGPGQKSRLGAYLPLAAKGVASAPTSTGPVELPARLSSVVVELTASLGDSCVQLEQLLDLEAGDVIPLDARVGDLATLHVEGNRFARGRLGTSQGQLAVRIEAMEHELPEDLR